MIALRFRCMAISLGLLACCGDETPDIPEAPAPGVILEVDGLRISEDDIAWWLDYVQDYQPTAGTKSITKFLLEMHLIPLKAAQRDFMEQRSAALEQAKNLRSVVGNSLELQRKGAQIPGFQATKSFLRIELEPAVQPYAFAIENLGGVSEPIETARGFMLAASTDFAPGSVTLGDRVTLCRVHFWTHDDDEYRQWFSNLRKRLKGRVSYLDPKFAGILPAWILK